MSGIDFGRAAMLMEVIHKVTVVSPKSVSLLGLASAELNDMETQAKKELDAIATAEAQKLADAQARINAAQEAQRREEAEANTPKAHPVSLRAGHAQVMPGEPVPSDVAQEAAEPGSVVDNSPDLSRQESPANMNPEPVLTPEVRRF